MWPFLLIYNFSKGVRVCVLSSLKKCRVVNLRWPRGAVAGLDAVAEDCFWGRMLGRNTVRGERYKKGRGFDLGFIAWVPEIYLNTLQCAVVTSGQGDGKRGGERCNGVAVPWYRFSV